MFVFFLKKLRAKRKQKLDLIFKFNVGGDLPVSV
jgi:hypothetical protein